jgi:hypothetical protein
LKLTASHKKSCAQYETPKTILGDKPHEYEKGQNFGRNCWIPTTNNYRNLTFCNKYLTIMLKNHATFGFATQPVKLALRAATAIEFKFT